MNNNNAKYTAKNAKTESFNIEQSKIMSLTEKAAKRAFEDKTFGDEWKIIFSIANVAKIVLGIGSACTVFFALYVGLSPIWGAFFSGLVGLAACLLLELMKGFVWGKTAKFVLKKQNFHWVLWVACGFLILLSVGGSVLGAYLLPTQAKQRVIVEAPQINVDSINNYFAAEIASINATTKATNEQIAKTTSNSTKRALSKTIQQQGIQKAAIIEQQNKALANAHLSNENARIDQLTTTNIGIKKEEENIKKQQLVCIGIAVVIETLLILCSVFISFYMYRLDYEINEVEQPQTAADQIPQNTAFQPILLSSGHVAPQSNKIGFFKDKDGSQPHTDGSQSHTDGNSPQIDCNAKATAAIETHQNDHQPHTDGIQQQQQQLSKLKYTKVCELVECGKPYLHKQATQKYCCVACRRKANRKK